MTMVAVVDKVTGKVLAFCSEEDVHLLGEKFMNDHESIETAPARTCPQCGGKGLIRIEENYKSYPKQKVYHGKANCCYTCNNWNKMNMTQGACRRLHYTDRVTQSTDRCMLYEPIKADKGGD